MAITLLEHLPCLFVLVGGPSIGLLSDLLLVRIEIQWQLVRALLLVALVARWILALSLVVVLLLALLEVSDYAGLTPRGSGIRGSWSDSKSLMLPGLDICD